MKKVKTIFRKDPADLGRVINEPNDGMEWVFAGEGVAFTKFDGKCCLVKGGKLYRRYTLRKGKTPPPNYEQVDFDPITEKGFGWVPVDFDLPQNKYHKEAWKNVSLILPEGTLELIGPKIQGNPEGLSFHMFQPHIGIGNGYKNVPLEFHELRDWLANKDIEGLVFHHSDGRMGKIRKSDFGLKRKSKLIEAL